MKDMRQEFADTLLEVGRADNKLVVLVGDISHFKLIPFANACPGRYYNIGICEQTIVNMAAGLSIAGFYPVVHTISPFIVERAYEQIKLDYSYQCLSANIITVGSAFDYSTLGCSHHCYTDFALLKPLQNTQIFFPSSPTELNILFKNSYNNGMINYFRVPKLSHGLDFPGLIEPGKAVVVHPGRDISIIVTGPQLRTAMAASSILKARSISAEVIYVHTIKPLDVRVVTESLNKTRRAIVVEEHSMYGGLGDDVVRTSLNTVNIKFDFISIPDRFIRDYGSYEDICEVAGFTEENIVEKADKLVRMP